MLIGPARQGQRQAATQLQAPMPRQAIQANMDYSASQGQAGLQPGISRGPSSVQKKQWSASMGMVPSSRAGTMPPRPITASAQRTIVRAANNQTAPQARLTHSQPASFQEYAPIGTPDKQYMMPVHSSQAQAMHTAAAQFNMPCSQPCSGIDSTDCTPVRPSSTQSFSQPRPFSSSPAQQQGQGMLSRLQNTPSCRNAPARQPSPGQTLSSSQRQPGHTMPSSQGRPMSQQQQAVRPSRGPLPLQPTMSQPSSQTLTPQSNSCFQTGHPFHHSQQSSRQPVQGIQTGQDGHGGHNSQPMPSSQGLPQMYLTQPSEDMVAWSEDQTQADPPVADRADTGVEQQQQQQQHADYRITVQSLQVRHHQDQLEPHTAGVTQSTAAAESPRVTDPAPNRLLMKMKSRAAAQAINNAVAFPSADMREQDLPAPAQMHKAMPDLATLHHSDAQVQTSAAEAMPTGMSEATIKAAIEAVSEAAVNAAVKAAAEAAASAAATAATKAAEGFVAASAEQSKQAIAAITATQEECEALAASVTATAAAQSDAQHSKHTDVLQKLSAVSQSCTNIQGSFATLQEASDMQGRKLIGLESTCQTMMGLMHSLAEDNSRALTAFQEMQARQAPVAVLRCMDSCTQTSPSVQRHQGVQAGVTMMADVAPATAQGIKGSVPSQSPAAMSLPSPVTTTAAPKKPLASAKPGTAAKSQAQGKPGPVKPTPKLNHSSDVPLQQQQAKPGQAKPNLKRKQSLDALLQQQQAKQSQLRPSLRRKQSPNAPLQQQQQQQEAKHGQAQPSLKHRQSPTAMWQQEQQQQAKQNQAKPSLKRKQSQNAVWQQEQQRLKQQKRVYHEFSTQETTTSSGGNGPVTDDTAEICSQLKPFEYPVKADMEPHNTAAAVAAGPKHLPVADTAALATTDADKSKQAEASPEIAALAWPQAYTHARTAKKTPINQSQPASTARPAATGQAVSKHQQSNRQSAAAGTHLHTKAPQATAARTSQATAQILHAGSNGNSNGKHKEAKTAGGFADLLEAVLSQQNSDTSPEPVTPATGEQISTTGGKASALQDVTNTQGKRADHNSGLPAAPKAVPAAEKNLGKPKKKADPVVFTRRSARVHARKDDSKRKYAHRSQEQGLGNIDMFGGDPQESMPSIDDKDIERQVKERMQRHRRKNMKRFSKMSK